MASHKQSKSQIELSIIVLSYNTAQLTKLTIESILQSITSHVSYEILVLDNGSKDDSVTILKNLAKKYTNLAKEGDYGFDKTEIRVKLFTAGGIHISRSQARRVLAGLEKFKIVLFDYENVPLVGQAFADEIYRVFQERHPDIRLENENMSEGVKFMIERARNEAKKSR